jgi:DNA polymerase III epsilon subunit-like protein
MNVVVFDCETTGLDWKRNSIVSLGAVALPSGNTFYEECRILPGTEIDVNALGVNGFTKDEVLDSNKQSARDLYMHFAQFCKENNAEVLSGFNIEHFDLKMLFEIYKKENLDWYFPTKYVDTKLDFEDYIFNNPRFAKLREQIETIYHFNTNNSNTIQKVNHVSLNKSMKFYGIDDEPEPHNALGGAKYGAELFTLLYYKKHFIPEFSKFATPIEFRDINFAPNIKELNLNKLTQEFSG